MARVYNFSAGPSMLPESVLKKAAAEMLDYEGTGQSVLEMSHRSKAFDKIKYIVSQKVNVVATAEEMSYPKAQEPELAAEMDRLAKENGVSILGTGINPGLIMDLLVLILKLL